MWLQNPKRVIRAFVWPVVGDCVVGLWCCKHKKDTVGHQSTVGCQHKWNEEGNSSANGGSCRPCEVMV